MAATFGPPSLFGYNGLQYVTRRENIKN